MATVPSASPRPSLSLLRSPSSSRTSLDTISNPPSLSRASTTLPGRRNRAALRDYYKLKTPAPTDTQHSPSVLSPTSDAGLYAPTRLEKLDKEGFDAGGYVRQVLEVEGLGGLLALENELVGEVRSLDGERKALVYDNYSKLISATETIKKMRSNMDPLAPATVTLAPAIAHIAEMAVGLANELGVVADIEKIEAERKRDRQRQLVERALRGPETLQTLIDQNQHEQAASEWEIILKILDRCGDVQGSRELRERCERIMNNEDAGDDEDDEDSS